MSGVNQAEVSQRSFLQGQVYMLTSIVVRLHRGHLDTQDTFRLRRETLDDVSLKSPEHDVLKLGVEVLDLGLLIRVVESKVVDELDCAGRAGVEGQPRTPVWV